MLTIQAIIYYRFEAACMVACRGRSPWKIKPRLLADFGQFYTRTVLLGGRHDGLGGGRRGATQGLYKLPFPGQPVQAALKQA